MGCGHDCGAAPSSDGCTLTARQGAQELAAGHGHVDDFIQEKSVRKIPEASKQTMLRVSRND